MEPTLIAVDLAKSVFEVARADGRGRILERRRLTRSQFERFLRQEPPTRVVFEACGTAHHWARVAASNGHRPCLLPPQHVRPYRRGNKTDRTDTAAVVAADRSGEILPVLPKTAEQQATLAHHRLREQYKRTRTARLNAVRGLLREQGLPLPSGPAAVLRRAPELIADPEIPLPYPLRELLADLLSEIHDLELRMAKIERHLALQAQGNELLERLDRLPGFGLLTASAWAATLGDGRHFQNGRRVAAWLGLVPKEISSGSYRRLGAITKRGDTYLRTLLTHGARSVLLAAKRQAASGRQLPHLQRWALQVEKRCGHNRATIALANKLARIAWAVGHHHREFNQDHRSVRPKNSR